MIGRRKPGLAGTDDDDADLDCYRVRLGESAAKGKLRCKVAARSYHGASRRAGVFEVASRALFGNVPVRSG